MIYYCIYSVILISIFFISQIGIIVIALRLFHLMCRSSSIWCIVFVTAIVFLL